VFYLDLSANLEMTTRRKLKLNPPAEAAVADVFRSYPPLIRSKLVVLRHLIFQTAEVTDGVGPISETLKWGEPAYLTPATKAGSTIRIGWKASAPQQYAMYFNCQTTLVDTFRTLFPELDFEGNRAILFDESEDVDLDSLAVCVEAALTYHLRKKTKSPKRATR
jgi:hypothetical protein